MLHSERVEPAEDDINFEATEKELLKRDLIDPST